MSENDQFKLASMIKTKHFANNTLICRQDDVLKSVYFIKSGMVKLLRKVDFKVPSSQKEANDSEFLIQDPEDMDYFTANIDQKLLEVDELINGDNFGEMSMINKSRIEYSVITSIPTEVYVLEEYELMKHDKSDQIYKNLAKNAKQFPADIDLRKSLIEMNKWTSYKKGLT